jgi:glycosyltransferase involved in cell wall biosynthesis
VRILVAVNTYPDGGGIASIVENFLHTLVPRYEVHLAIVEARKGFANRLPLAREQIHELGYSNAINPLLAPFSVAYLVQTARFLRGLVSELAPRLLIVQDALNLPVPAAFAVRSCPTKLIVMDHGTLTNAMDRDWQALMRDRLSGPKRALFRLGFAADRPWRAVRWRLGLSLADGVWFTGEELRPYAAHAGQRARVYAQIVPSDFCEPDANARSRARRALGLGADHTVVNMVTRLNEEKGLEAAVAAIEGQARRREDLRVMIAGDGTLRPWLEGRIAAQGLGEAVSLLGVLDRREVKRLHEASDFHLYTGTIGCGISIALLEAMACGVIPIVSDVPAAHTQLVDGAGWVFQAGDTGALKTALLAALETTSPERARLREVVRRRLGEYREPSLMSLVNLALEQA